jgi:uncharacterized protein (DUF1778 family)
MTVNTRRRSRRLDVRTTDEERSIIDAAVAASDTDLTAFVVGSLLTEARRVPGDRTQFTLSAEARDPQPVKDVRKTVLSRT